MAMKYGIRFHELAKRKGLTVVDCGNGHIQIKGGHLLVNYYPFSKNHTAYVGATRKDFHDVSPELALSMAMSAPPVSGERVERKSSNYYKRQKVRLLKKSPKCKWCGCKLSIESATLEHIIPLSRGGLDNENNYALACKPCNHGRGNNMPELNG